MRHFLCHIISEYTVIIKLAYGPDLLDNSCKCHLVVLKYFLLNVDRFSWNDQASIMNTRFFFAFVIAMALVADLEATCCKRKPDFGCCGNGPCNIFCCNCDGGCNEICEKTNCDTEEWLKCAGALTACAAACVDPDLPSCIACLGPLYDECKKCYPSSMDTQKAVYDAKYMFNAYRRQIFRKKSSPAV